MNSLTYMLIAVIGVAGLLECDLGRRRLGRFRVWRAPVLSLALVLPLAPRPDLGGRGLALELGALAVGAAVALLAVRGMPVHWDHEHGHAVSRGGLWYTAVLVAFAAVRVLFSYGTQHWFTQSVVTFLTDNRITLDAFGDALIGLSLGLSLTRTGYLVLRHRAVRRGALTAAGGAVKTLA